MFDTLTTKKARVAYIKEKLGTDAQWAVRGLMRIYANQTAAEQEDGTTTQDNGIGFTGLDAEFLTSLAKQYEKRGSLSEKQLGFPFKKMPKYAGQLEKCCVEKAVEPS